MKQTKINILLIVLNAIMITVLFYATGLGINCLIFSIVLIAVMFVKKTITINSIPHLILLVISSAALLYNFQSLTFIIYLFNVLLLLGSIHQGVKNTSYKLGQGFIGLLATLPLSLSTLNFKTDKDEFKLGKFLPYLIALPIGLVFLLLYKSGNPIFEHYLNKIDLSFIEAGSFFFFCFALYLSFPIVLGDQKLWFDHYASTKAFIYKSDTATPQLEAQSFKVIIWTLSVLLGFFHLADACVLLAGQLPENLSMTDYLHQGFWTLVFSVILSVVLILIFFRNQLGYHPASKPFKTLAYVWLALNVILLISTGIKNSIYVMEYGLTYKRIAVFAFLVVSMILIATCALKVNNNLKINVFFGKSILICTAFITLLSIVPWDHAITTYNLSNGPKQVDLDYLLGLNNNTYTLYKHRKSEKFSIDQQFTIANKMRHEKLTLNSDWQAWSYIKQLTKEQKLDIQLPETQEIFIEPQF